MSCWEITLIRKLQNQSRLLKLQTNCNSCQDHEVEYSGADHSIDQAILTITLAGNPSIGQIRIGQDSSEITGSIKHNIPVEVTQTEHVVTVAEAVVV